MNQAWDKVRNFHEKFNHPIASSPVFLSRERAKARYGWMLEELNEFIEAGDIVGQADAMADLIYFALGTLVEMGCRPDDIFNVVHEANMAKLWEDGKPRYNKKDGKVIKPDNWEDPKPKIKALIDNLIEHNG